jgi:hypothetical protein
VSRADSREYIIEVNDSAMSLLGESQEEDRRNIAELVLARMENCVKAQQIQLQNLRARRDSESGIRRDSSSSNSASREGSSTTAGNPRGGFFRQNSNVSTSGGVGGGEEGEDTMKNLRKTFAGIFGDM